MTGQSWVINLARRHDRRKKFTKNYNDLGPNLPLNIINAIDGTNAKDFNIVEIQQLLKSVSEENDYNDNPRIRATVLSHMNVWQNIANGDDDYGMIFEDDIFFRTSNNQNNHLLDLDCPFKKLWPDMEKNFPKSFLDGESIIYFGVGDFLPIHTNPPTEQMLKAQEKDHVTKIINKYFGIPKFKSAYVFDWLGGFSYILSKKGAQRLLDLSKSEPIKTAVDVWLKKSFENKMYLTVPLLTYHSNYDFNIYDSDTWGVSTPIISDDNDDNDDDEKNKNKSLILENKNYTITFLIPTKNRIETLEKTIKSILLNSSGHLKINFVVYVDDDDLKTKEFIKNNAEKYNIIILAGNNIGRRYLHTMYNMMSKLALNSTFIAIWDDDTIITTNSWDKKLLDYYKISGIENRIETDLNIFSSSDTAIACFQLVGNEKSSWDFRNPILTSNFIRKLGHVSKSAHVLEYIKFISYLSHVNMFIRDIDIEKIVSNHHDYDRVQLEESFKINPTAKYDIDKDIGKIVNSPEYRACGLWIKNPKEWKTKILIGNMADELNMKR